jgi:ribosomal protein S18 acetylase RimI-like enzyme
LKEDFMEISVHPLDPSRLEHYLAFFDRDAFADNPEWASCYCMFYHIPDPDWDARTGAQNRETSAALIRSGSLRGFLAYDGRRPIGWCNANGKERFQRLAAESSLWGAASPGEPVLAVVCFVVAAAYRGQGIARRLLQEACSAAAREGYHGVEAYPRKETRSTAQAYHGPLALYQSEGFMRHRELGEFWIVRRDLRRPDSRS